MHFSPSDQAHQRSENLNAKNQKGRTCVDMRPFCLYRLITRFKHKGLLL
nr:MAG TPA: hypothetical protein [Caudoviricetes sp.]